MSVNDTPSGGVLADAPPANRLYISVGLLNGRISGVQVGTTAPDPFDLWWQLPSATVWSSGFPNPSASADKVFDSAYSSAYRDERPELWSLGERVAHDFQCDENQTRRFLRTVEGHLIKAGVFSARTGLVSHRVPGLTIGGNQDHSVYRHGDGWRIARHAAGEEYYSVLPAHVSPRLAARAILVRLVRDEVIDLAELSRLSRLLVRFDRWRTAGPMIRLARHTWR